MGAGPLIFLHENQAISDFPKKKKKQRGDGPESTNVPCKSMFEAK